MVEKRYDVAVVGSGFAGALIADSLVRSGLKVVILEAGSCFEDEKHLRTTLLESYHNSDESELFAAYSDYLAPTEGVHGHPYYDQLIGSGYSGNFLRLVGGTGLAWLGTSIRMCPSDFLMKTLYNKGRDWPISYSDLEPWYCVAERELGVAGTIDADILLNSYHSECYPMPPVPLSYVDQYVKERLTDVTFEGKTLYVSSTPQSRNTVDGYNGRPVCEGYASCVPLCPVGAKYDPLIHLRRALLNGAELLQETVVTHLDADATGKVTSATALQEGNLIGKIEARVFVVAANGIETPKLLLQSNQRFENGLANESGLVGCNLMDHLGKHSCTILREPIFPYRGPQSTSGIEVLRDGPFRMERAAFRTAFRNDGWRIINGGPSGQEGRLGGPNLSASVFSYVEDEGLFGSHLKEKLGHVLLRQFALQSVVEMLPDSNNRVTLSRNLRDRNGLPRPAIHFQIDDYTRAGFAAAADLHMRIFDTLGVSANSTFIHLNADPDRADAAGSHIMGTTVMGDDPRTSVVDSNCRAHDHPNLFIAGSAPFPTGGTSNSTLTICALALRISNFLGKELPLL
ncbi:choline dehydrogenase-like flavoprotein [Sinorhizobium meliloti]|uniref:GMC family oxidoreductase n=1 Tax=Rhizobium meliloti TaxID=382 RepID=UPI000FDB9CFC|nr:GMC family oxidoreductase [Sinorhizobium meliloti]RVK43337.1 GMC family oxidoreductase [Sinorhizobium meliloti]